MLSGSTREEGCNTVHFQEFSWLAQDDGESLTKTATYLLESLQNAMRIFHKMYSFIPSGYKPKNLKMPKYKIIPTTNGPSL